MRKYIFGAIIFCLMFAASCQEARKSNAKGFVSAPSSDSLNLSVININQINISWSAVNGAAYYELYRSANGSGGHANIYIGDADFYEDKGLESDVSYCYRLAACSSVVCSAKSDCAYANTGDPSAAVPAIPAPPVISRAGTNQIQVSWSVVEDVLSYKLYRSASANGLYAEVYSGSGVSHQDTGLAAENDYHYKLAACNGAGCSAKSNHSATTTGATLGDNDPPENYWTLIKHKSFSQNPSIVNIFFQAADYNGSLVGNFQADDFILKENGVAVSPRESFQYVDRKNSLEHELKTVILLDVSPSMTEDDLNGMIAAAKSLVVNPDTGESVMLRNQKIAVYAFAETLRLLTGFTDNVATLTNEIDSARDQDLGIATNLYGAIIEALGCWSDDFDLSKITRGALIVFTDGGDTANSSTMSSVVSSRGDKDIYTVAIGDAVGSSYLSQIGNAGGYRLNNFAELKAALSQVSSDMQRFISQGFYALRHASPKRSGVNTLTLALKGNVNNNANAGLSYSFSAAGFSAVVPDLELGDEVFINPDEPTIFKARTLWANNVEYSWRINNSGIISINVDANNDSRAELTGILWQGRASLTVEDTLNGLSESKEVIIGTIHAQGVDPDGSFTVERGHNISLAGVNSPRSPRVPKYSWLIADPSVISIEATDDASATFKALNVGSTDLTIRDIANNRARNITANVTHAILPEVSTVIPADNSTNISVSSSISVTFSESMNAATITVNTDDSVCSGTLRLSLDNFSTCVQMSSAPSNSDNNKTFAIRPASDLEHNADYEIMVSDQAKDTYGDALAGAYTAVFRTENESIAPRVSYISERTAAHISVNFSEEMDADSVTANASDDACSGGMQISNNNFSSCVQISAISSENNQNFTLTPSHALNSCVDYQIKISEAVKDKNGNFLESAYESIIRASLNCAWTEAVSSAPWGARKSHAGVVFDNKIWVIGGYDGGRENDVWYSSDGVNWTEAASSAPWSKRYAHSGVVFDNKIWVIGGYDGGRENDVWYSSDGINWTEVVSSAPWSGRYAHSGVVFDNKMWVIGGYEGNYNYKNDVWYSSDGINWTEAVSSAPWSGRSKHSGVVFDNKIWVIGGYDGKRKNDVWYSSDGINWTEVVSSAPWSKRYDHSGMVFDNKIWVIGGYDGKRKNDVWYSSDGINWTEVVSSAPWSGRYAHAGVVFGNKIWIIGGYDGSHKNDVWHID